MSIGCARKRQSGIIGGEHVAQGRTLEEDACPSKRSIQSKILPWGRHVEIVLRDNEITHESSDLILAGRIDASSGHGCGPRDAQQAAKHCNYRDLAEPHSAVAKKDKSSRERATRELLRQGSPNVLRERTVLEADTEFQADMLDIEMACNLGVDRLVGIACDDN